MTSIGFGNPIVGGETLIRQAIQSPNFVPGVSGWSIDKNGNAFFNDISLTGGSLVVEGTGEGVFVYSGTPAAGNLVASIAESAGTDAYGNSYVAGFGSYNGTTNPMTQMNQGMVTFYNQPGTETGYIQGGANAIVISTNVPGSTVSQMTLTSSGSNPFIVVGPSVTFRAQDPVNGGAETWHNMMGATNWVAGTAQYTLLPFGGASQGVGFRGTITTPASGSYNGVSATLALPSAYWPSVARRWPVVNTNAASVTGYAVLSTSGVISFQNLPGSYNNSNVEIDGIVWL